MAIPQIPIVDTPKLHDVAFNAFNTRLVVQLPWLTHAFGEAQMLTRNVGDKTIVYPGVYAGKNIENEYKSVLPDEFMGSNKAITGFSFFDVIDTSYDQVNVNSFGFINSTIGIVFWFNLRKVLASPTEYRNLNKVVDQILKAIKKSSRGFQGEIKVTGWTVKADEIYTGYSLRETDQQFLMQPYAGVRFNCNMKILETC